MIDELTIEASHLCPLNCVFCSSKSSIFNIKHTNRLDTKEILKIIDRFDPKVVRWSGGEPFVYLDDKILRKVSTRVNDQTVTTCGMYPDKATRLAHWFSEVRFSIYGWQRTHDQLTRVFGSWGTALRGLWMIRDNLGFPSPETGVLITSSYLSKNQIKEVKHVAKAFRVGTRITGLVPTGGIRRHKENVISPVCSLGGESCRYESKRLVLPNGMIIHCAVEKRGFSCPHKSESLGDKF